MFDVSWMTLFVTVVPRRDVVDANSKMSLSRSLSFVTGPPLAGGLVQAVTAPVTLLLDAFSFLGSAAFLTRIRAKEPPVEHDGSGVFRSLRAGLRFVLRDELIRPDLLCAATVNLFNFVFHAIFVLYATSELGVSPGTLGLALGAGAVGGIVGALIAPRLEQRIGIGRSIVLGSVLFPAPLVLVPIASGSELRLGTDARRRRVLLQCRRDDLRRLGREPDLPPHARPDPGSRTAGTFRFVNYGIRPIGALLGGALGTVLGLQTALWIGVLGALLGVVWLLFSPIPRLREARRGRLMETRVLRTGPIRALLAAETISTSGAQMTWVALPWFVLTTTGSATRMSIVIAFEAIGIALAGFLGVRVLNRLGARRTMLLCDACRGPLMLVIPLCHWAGVMSFGLIAAVAFAVGAFTGPHFAAQRVIIPELLGEDEGVVSQASALFQGANRVTLLLGPPLAGVLIGFIGAPAVLVVDAATYAVAVFLLAVFVPATKPLPPEKEEDRGFRAGLRWVAQEPLVRAWRFSLIVGDMAWQAIFISLPVLVVTRYDSDPRIVGAMFAAFGVGAVLGNTVAYRLVKRLDGLTLIARLALGQALPLWLLVFEVPAWAAIGVLGASGLANGLINPSLHAIITLRIPPELRATVISSFMTVFALAMPIGILGAGPLLDLLGVTPVFAICAAIQTGVMALVALAALRARTSGSERAAPGVDRAEAGASPPHGSFG